MIELWEFSFIPLKDNRSCWDIVKNCVNMWAGAKQEVKQSSTFQKQLDTLLDLRPDLYRSLSDLKEFLKKSGNSALEIDYQFFKGQLQHSQATTCLPKNMWF